MKRTILFLLALMALSLPAYAADFTAQEISDATLKARFEVPQTEKWMRVWMPSLFTKMNAITSTSTGAVTYPVLATVTTNSGAKLVGVLDTANYFTGTTLETILAELGLSRSKLALTTSGNGASLIGVFDTAGYFAGADVEAVLANVGAALLALNVKVVNVVDIVSATAPADPNVEGYRVFMSATNGGLNVGYIYVWNDTTNAWDAGTLLANASMVASKGNPPDVVIGGTAAANFVKLSGKVNLTVPGAVGNIATLDANGQITDGGDTLSEYSKLVSAPTNENLVMTDALGQSVDSGVAKASIAGAVTMGGIFNDQMRNSTNTAQSLADATAEIVDLEDVELAGDITYTAGSTDLATIPAGGTGLYTVYWTGTFAAGAGTYNSALIYLNGALLFTASEVPDNANPITAYDYEIHYFTAGDTLALWAKQDSGGALDLTAGQMAIQRLQ